MDRVPRHKRVDVFVDVDISLDDVHIELLHKHAELAIAPFTIAVWRAERGVYIGSDAMIRRCGSAHVEESIMVETGMRR